MKKEDEKTLFYDDGEWMEPVETPDDLPTEEVPEGQMCFVKSEGTVFVFTAGTWAKPG